MSILRKKQQEPARRRNVAHLYEGRASSAELDERYAFRRNRTLTGSLSSGVSSVNEHRAELKSARVHTHDLRKRRRRLTAVFIVVAGMAGMLAWLIFESIAVPQVVATGIVAPLDNALYERKIQDYLNGHFLERSRVTLNVERLAAYLQDEGCPEVASISPDMQFSGIGASRLTLTMRKPVVGWKTGSTQLYVDVEGNAFQRNYFPVPGVQIVDETGIQATNNQVLASNRFLSFIGKTIGRFSVEGLTVTKVVLPVGTTRQLLVSLEGVDYPVKVSVDRSAAEQAEDAARSIRYLQGKGIGAEYIDVRVSGKAYYR